MRRISLKLLALGCLLTVLAATGCGKGSYRAAQSHDVAGTGDPNVAYPVIVQALQQSRYQIVEENPASYMVRVRSHIDQYNPERVSLILIQVDGSAVHMSASGYLVHADGSVHHTLNNEMANLQRLIVQRIGAASQQPPPPPETISTAPTRPSPPTGSLPMSWSEPAYDPAVWGHGNFTCLPVKLPADGAPQLQLRLSNGENADALLSLAYAPELCRSPGSCRLAGGCPALGIGDQDRVSRLADRLSRREIGSQATLLYRGQAVAVIDLAKHGSIAQAMTDSKH